MLAITFAAVAARFAERTHLVLEEANTIGTAYLRTDLLPKADRAEIRQLLDDYLTLRIQAIQFHTGEQFKQGIDRSEELHSELWSKAVSSIAQQPTLLSRLFINSMKDLIELHTKRINSGLYRRIPGIVWVVLYGVAVLAMIMGSYEVGASGSRRITTITLATALAFSSVIFLAIVLDRPLQHLAKPSQAALIDLQDKIRRSINSQASP